MARADRGGKGTFGDVRLPVSKSYFYPATRRRMVLAGGILAVVALAAATLSFVANRGGVLANGPLSSGHATLEDDCAACHAAFDEVRADACSVCHEKYGDRIGVYSFSSHYLYRTNDFQRLVPSEHEVACSACHAEHLGREAEITRVTDRSCLPCHDYGGFTRRHPEFDFAAEDRPDPAGIRFPHIRHVRELMVRQGLLDVERTCLYCHHAQPDGKGFQPIEFERSCDSCHLTTAVATTRLPIRNPSDPESVGVDTLEAILADDAPGTRWALFSNPAEFAVRGSGVTKTPVYHEDPWILENLRRLRRRLYRDPGLADLLRASAEVPPNELPELYWEALVTLRDYATGLRSRPEPAIQEDLARIDGLLAELERALRDPYTPLDETAFLLALEKPIDLPPELAEEIRLVIGDLTQPCQQCHFVERATLERVQTDQRTLRRAEFNHRAHILHRRCLDCHTAIPIADYLEDLEVPVQIAPEIDNAAIQNLPRIAVCRECHNPDLASSRCVTCHLFHPDPSRRSQLLLYLEEAPPLPELPEPTEN